MGYIRTRERKDGKTVHQLVINLGVDDVTGKRVRDFITLPIGTTKKEAERALREKLSLVDNQEYIPDTNITVAEFLKTWVESYIVPHKSPSTVCGYKTIIERYIIPRFGRTKLQNLSTLSIQQFYNSLSKKSPLSDKPLSAKSIRNLHMVFNASLKRAVMLDIIRKNPAQNIELEKCPKYKADIYNSDELKQLFQAIKGTDLEVAVSISVVMGVRRGDAYVKHRTQKNMRRFSPQLCA